MKFVKRNTTKGSEGSNVTIKSYSNSSSSSSSSLTSHNIWGQPFDGTNDVTGDMQNVGSITATGNIQTDGDIIIKQLDTDGNEVEGGDLTMSVENADAQFSGKENYIFDGKIKGNSAEITNNIEVGGKGSFDSDLTVKGISKLKDVTSNNISNADTIRTKNLESYGNSTLNDVTSNNITNSDTIKTKNLEVTGSAHFFELIIDKIKAAGGAALFTPADGFDIDIVEANGTSGYKLYWQCQDGNGKQRDNMWKVNDQALCMSFNQAKVGTSHSVNNKYYWCLVTDVSDSSNPTLIDGEYYNYIVISSTVCDGTVNPEKGDSIVMCGYRGTDDAARQSAIYISAYSSLDNGLTAPLLAQYKGINDFNLESHRNSYYDAVSAKFIGEFEATDGQNIIDIINNKIAESEASIKLDTKNIVLSVSEKTKERRNLLKGTTFHRQIDNFLISNAARIEMNSGYNGTNCIKVIDDLDGTPHYVGVYWDGSIGGRSIKIEKGKKYTISCYYKTNDTNGIFALEAIYTDKESNAKRLGRPKYLSTNMFHSKYNQWELFTTVIDTTDAESDYIAFNFWENNDSESGKIEAYICRPMVEEGDTYYGWTVSDEDNDYIGANLIDNSRTFEVGGNTLEVKGTKTLKDDVYELTYEGLDEYNTFYRIDTTNFKLNTDYTLSFDVKGNADFIVAKAYYPITKTPYTLLNEPIDTPMNEQNGDGTKEGYTTLLVDSNIEREKKLWVHFKFLKRLPSQIFFQFTKNSDQSGITVTITKPKIEEGANVTQWTEKKTDIDNTITTINSNVATLDQKADGISAKVSENTTTINNINGQVTENKTNIANLTVKADGIESTVSSMSNGTGTNLFSFTNANFNNFNCRPSIQMNGFFTLGLNQRFYRVMNLGCNGVTGDYVVSFDAMVWKGSTNGTVVNVNFCDEWAIENNSDITLTTEFKHYVLHFKNIQSAYLRKDLYDGFIDFEPKVLDETNQLYVANFMLERGTIPSANFTLSEADKNNFKSNNVFTAFDKASTATIVDETINGKAVKAYKQEGLPKDTQYIDTLVGDLKKKFKIEPWKVYTLSFWAKSSISGRAIQNFLYPNTANTGIGMIQYKDINGAGTQTAYSAAADGYTACELDTTWRKFYIHWQLHQLPESYACICGRIISADLTVWIADVKLEEGYICDENISNQDTYSSINQTANEILAQVNDTYVKIGDGNITLNGDTKVNGSLTLNDSKQGFLLLGNGGTTEISPKSIGSYTAFKDRTSNVIRTHYLSDVLGVKIINTDIYSFEWSVTQQIGKYKKGDYIKLTNYTNDVYANLGTEQKHLGVPSATFYILENGTQTKTISIGEKTNVDIDYYTVIGDNVDIQVTGRFTITANGSIWKTNQLPRYNIEMQPTINVTVEWDNEVPNQSAFMLIGYDGWGVNFGSNKTVYCGNEGFIASYGDSLFKINSDGIVEKKNSVAIVNGSSSINSPSHYYLKEGVDTILCKSGYTIITLPSNPYQGQSVKIFDKSPQEVYVNFNGYMVGANSDYNSRTHQTKYALDGTAVRTFTFIGDTWFMEYMG